MTHKVSFEWFCPECGLALTENSPRQCWEAWEKKNKKFTEYFNAGGGLKTREAFAQEFTVTPKNHDRTITVTITVKITED